KCCLVGSYIEDIIENLKGDSERAAEGLHVGHRFTICFRHKGSTDRGKFKKRCRLLLCDNERGFNGMFMQVKRDLKNLSLSEFDTSFLGLIDHKGIESRA